MNVRFSVNGPALHKEITRSMRKRNNANDFEQNVKGGIIKESISKNEKRNDS